MIPWYKVEALPDNLRVRSGCKASNIVPLSSKVTFHFHLTMRGIHRSYREHLSEFYAQASSQVPHPQTRPTIPALVARHRWSVDTGISTSRCTDSPGNGDSHILPRLFPSTSSWKIKSFRRVLSAPPPRSSYSPASTTDETILWRTCMGQSIRPLYAFLWPHALPLVIQSTVDRSCTWIRLPFNVSTFDVALSFGLLAPQYFCASYPLPSTSYSRGLFGVGDIAHLQPFPFDIEPALYHWH